MKLVDTVNGMNSADYKERFIAEYQQLVIRYRGLKSMLYKWDRGIDLGFVPTCPRSTYNMQVKAMTDYIAVLEARAVTVSYTHLAGAGKKGENHEDRGSHKRKSRRTRKPAPGSQEADKER